MKWMLMVMLAVPAWSCPTGCTSIDKNTCACDAAPLTDDKAAPGVKPSDELPPRGNRPTVHADMPQSLIASDSDADRAKEKADQEGKKAAGL